MTPFLSVTGGCFWDTSAFDRANAGACFHTAWPDNFGISFSVGESVGYEDYQFSNPSDWSVTWSGACSGSSNECFVRVDASNFDNRFVATATVLHRPTGRSKTYNVTARFSSLE